MLSAPPKGLGTNQTVEAHIYMLHEAPLSRIKQNKFCLGSNDLAFICDGISNVDGYKGVVLYKHTALWAPTSYGVTNYGSG